MTNKSDWRDRIDEHSEIEYGDSVPKNFESKNIFDGIGVGPFDFGWEDSPNQIDHNITEREKARKVWEDNPKRNEIDYDLRRFLYDRNIDIPTNEMSREFYLKERVNSNERKNLVDVLNGFGKKMSSLNKSVWPFCILGVGTSTYSDEWYLETENRLKERGFDSKSKIFEKASEYGRATSYENYLHTEDVDSLVLTREAYEKLNRETLDDYVKEKTLGEVFSNKGEDLDYVICLDSVFSDYLTSISSEGINYLRDSFKLYLKDSGYEFNIEKTRLDGSCFWESEGELFRLKDIKPNTRLVETYRVIPETGREMHFYLYNQMADFKIREERINNRSFVQLGRSSSYFGSREFGLVNDLEAAIKNGEETGVFENPLILKWKK